MNHQTITDAQIRSVDAPRPAPPRLLPVEPMLSSPIVAFMRLRHMARVMLKVRSDYYDLLRQLNRARARLEGSPFNAHRISEIDKATTPIKAELEAIRKHFEQMGAVLIDLAPKIDRMTTLEQRLELLNCNHADTDHIDGSDIGMVMLMAAYCVEDSAQHRGDEWNNRPLHAAVNAEMQRVMFKTAEGRAASDQMFDKLFAPGGMFEAVPRLYRLPDGTILRQGPALTVHDASGSRVVERMPT